MINKVEREFGVSNSSADELGGKRRYGGVIATPGTWWNGNGQLKGSSKECVRLSLANRVVKIAWRPQVSRVS